MKRIFLVAFFAFLFCGEAIAEVNYKNLRKLRVYSTVLKEYRDLTVLLPNEYEGSSYRYPIIYLFDAERNFEVGIETLSFLMENHFIPPHIVVGVPNTDRFRDMTPVDSVMSKTIFPTRGGADNFIKALEIDIFPFLAGKYRVSALRVVTGHNYSGLFVVHAFLTRPDLFDRYLAFSPTLWWNNSSIISDMENFLISKSTLRKYLFISFAKEAENMLQACKSLISVFESHSPSDLHWGYEGMPDENHYSLYRKSLMAGLKNIFKDYKYPDIQNLTDEGLQRVKSYQQDILLNYGRDEKLPYSLLESACLQLKDEEKFDQSLQFLRYTISNYTDRAEAYFYVGEIYERKGQLKKALEYYETAHDKDKGQRDYEQKFVAIQKLLVDHEKDTTQNKVGL